MKKYLQLMLFFAIIVLAFQAVGGGEGMAAGNTLTPLESVLVY